MLMLIFIVIYYYFIISILYLFNCCGLFVFNVKRMKIYKKPDSRKEYVKYKGELVPLVEYKKTMKEIVRAKNKKTLK